MTMLSLSLITLVTLAAGDYAVVPGERIGKVRLGMSSKEVHATLGKPSGAFDRKDGQHEEWWSGGRNQVQQVRVLFSKGVATQVSVTSRAFKTADGLSTASAPARIIAQRLRRSGYESHGSGGGLAYYYDDVPRGLAWMMTGTGIRQDGEPPFHVYAVIVHATGRDVAVDDDLEPGEPDEKCTPDTPDQCESM